VIKQHKRSALAKLSAMSDLMRRYLPELGDNAQMFCMMSLVFAGGLSTYVPPPASLLAAYAEEPDLGALHLELRDALQFAFTSTLVGVLPRD
jgi:hypothetical protein